MRDLNRAWIAVVAGTLALAAGCGGSSDETSTGATTAETSTETTATTPTETTPVETTPTKPVATILRIVVRGGRAEGGLGRATVKQGTRVRLVVSSDAADEVHLHGYDLTTGVAPGRQGRIAFVAKVPGRFEIELEDAGVQIGELEVRP